MNYRNKYIKIGASHPLRIDEVNIPDCRGRIGMTFCPGKKQLNAASGAWDRDRLVIPYVEETEIIRHLKDCLTE